MSDLESTVAILKEFFTPSELTGIAEAIAPATIPGPPWLAETILRHNVSIFVNGTVEVGECLVCGATVRRHAAGVHASWHNRGCK